LIHPFDRQTAGKQTNKLRGSHDLLIVGSQHDHFHSTDRCPALTSSVIVLFFHLFQKALMARQSTDHN